MRTSIKMGGYVAGLAAIFVAALGVGGAVGSGSRPAPGGHNAGHAGDRREADAVAGAGTTPGGLQVAQDGYRLAPVTTSLTPGGTSAFAFRLIGPDGRPVTDYTPTHDKNLHLIAVRRDLSGFQHLHPAMADDGTWTTPLAVEAAGQYRLIADFQPAARAEALTLGVDVPAPGGYEPRPLPAPARTAVVDGYTVTLAGDLVPGTGSTLTLTVSRDGRPVTDLQPHLAAYGHLVALRDGDLAYLHVHPEGAPGDGRTPAGPDITFHVQVPSAGAYRLFLDFQHAGTVRTAEFTAYAGDVATTRPPTSPRSTPSPSAGHDTGHTHG
ncbi:hypothetical protein [Micromonospora sp. HM5-17]|uniref:hypothetical protein n=1 Tax=Micromonospora sp. HM5-17 TaxID=2487710 RepID=UPI000F48923E|nr:hypothetical protein [Micromonospora sp. HM5-17]ROT32995.1 hypothetical protein EF879_07540 [Micromonospora sp. HM5-17]